MTDVPDVFVHESSYVDEPCSVGNGTRIWHFCHVQAGAVIGRDCVLGQNVNVGGRAVLGDRVRVQNNVSIYDCVVLEDDTFCGPSMVFTNVINPRSHVSRKNEYMETRVGRGASIGANATVVCGNTIGPYAFVGAGSVVTKDIPAYALAYGNPARQHGWMCACGVRLPAPGPERTCTACGKGYTETDGALSPTDDS